MNTKDRLEEITILVVAILATILSIVDTFELTEPFPIFSWVSGKTPTFIVVLLAIIAIYLVLERRSKLDKTLEILKAVELRVGGAGIEILSGKTSYPQHLAQRATTTQKFILDTNLNQEIRRAVKISPQKEYSRIKDEKILRGQITFRKVEVIFHKEHLEGIIKRLIKYEGCDYYLRHYDAPPEAIPILHIMSFDDEHFYIGGFNLSDPSTEEKIIYVRSKEMADVLHEYWQTLWQKSRPLNEGRNINWDELKRIGKRLHISNDEFSSMVSRIRNEVQPAKRLNQKQKK